MRIIPPGSGIVHQVNLEYLARVVFNHEGFFYPDSLVGTDSHTTMIDGLGVLGWGKTPKTASFDQEIKDKDAIYLNKLEVFFKRTYCSQIYI